MFPILKSGRVCLRIGVLFGIAVAILSASGEDSKDYRFLGGEHPRSDREYPDGLREIVPIHELPPRIKSKPAWLSLIPDPSDTRGDYMVVYLVNDTDQPVPRAVGELQIATSQMNIGGSWFQRDPLVDRCGTVPQPEDLPAHHALVITALKPDQGDTDGVIRYCFPAANVASEPMPGRYGTKQAEWALLNRTFSVALNEAFAIGIEQGCWEEGEVARDQEDFAALLEIVRHYQLCVSQRRELHQWILQQRQKGRLGDDRMRGLDRMEETLGKEWRCHNDHQSAVNRCIAALESPPPGEFGTPERCVGTVWRYLCHSEMAIAFVSADARSRTKLVTLAQAALKGSNHSARNGAALFLARRSSEAQFPSARLHEFLESGVPEICLAGLEGLERRGKANEAGPWMLRQAADDPTLCSYYQILRSGLHGEMPQWEKEVIKRLLDHHAMEALHMMCIYPRIDAWALPLRCEAPLRRALLNELEPERRRWWQEIVERAADKKQIFPERSFPQALDYGIRQLDQFNAAEDSGLFQAFLDHPAGSFNFFTDGSSTRYFTAREVAREALRTRHIPLTSDVVTRIEFPPKVAPESPKEGIFTSWRATAGLYGLLGVAFLIVGFRFWRTRAA